MDHLFLPGSEWVREIVVQAGFFCPGPCLKASPSPLAGAEDEFCWKLRLRCQGGERLAKAFVLLNLEQPPAEGQLPPFRLLLTSPSQRLRIRHRSRGTRLLRAEACGLRFDVTEPFRSAEGSWDAQMCVKAVCPEKGACGAWRLGQRCPPFLATLWRSLPAPGS